jgi:hypothetical protein
MHACMHVYIYMYIYIYIYIHTYIRSCQSSSMRYMHIYDFSAIHAFVHVCACVYRIYARVCIAYKNMIWNSVCMFFAQTYTHLCQHVCMHTHTICIVRMGSLTRVKIIWNKVIKSASCVSVYIYTHAQTEFKNASCVLVYIYSRACTHDIQKCKLRACCNKHGP